MDKKTVAQNKKAYHDYFVEEKLECGVELKGTEVKSIREGKCSIKESWCNVINGQLFLNGMNISRYEQGSLFNHEEMRVKRLLAHKAEINKLAEYVARQGYTLVPIEVYFNEQNKVKIVIGVCKGKHNYDKREAIKEKDVKRNIDRVLRSKNQII